MRKPLLALSLVVTTGYGGLPVANVLAAKPTPANATTVEGSPAPPPPLSSRRASSGSSSGSATQVVSAAAIVSTALKYLGYPYTATGNSPSTGFSCVGFTSYVYRQNGIPIPGDLQGSLAYARQISFSSLLPGDLVYFQNTVWPGLSHVGIYIGGGKMVHSGWYNTGVHISSIRNDPSEGNYWMQHYMAANRPWTGQAGSTAIPTTPPAAPSTPSTSAGKAPSAVAPSGPSATVTAPSGLNLRSGPSTSTRVVTVLAPGTIVYIVGSNGDYYKVQLVSGTVGWADKRYVSQAGGAMTVGNPTAPARISKPGSTKRQSVIAVKATSLNVRSGPSGSATIIGSVSKGAKLVVIGHSGGWYKVRLPDGSIGWVSEDYVSGKPQTKATSPTTSSSRSAGGSTTSAALNVRSRPSLSSAVVSVIPVGGSYRIIGWYNGWAKVRLLNGMIGWVSSTAIGRAAPSYSSSTKSGSTTSATSGFRHKITAGVNIRAGASTKSAVVALAGAGTKVKILGFKNGWVLVRLPSGLAGYVLGMYVL